MRAKQTAQLIAESYGLNVESDTRLIEQNIGIFSGMTYSEINNRDDYMHDRSKRWFWIPENGESYCMIAGAIKVFFSINKFNDGG